MTQRIYKQKLQKRKTQNFNIVSNIQQKTQGKNYDLSLIYQRLRYKIKNEHIQKVLQQKMNQFLPTIEINEILQNTFIRIVFSTSYRMINTAQITKINSLISYEHQQPYFIHFLLKPQSNQSLIEKLINTYSDQLAKENPVLIQMFKEKEDKLNRHKEKINQINQMKNDHVLRDKILNEIQIKQYQKLYEKYIDQDFQILKFQDQQNNNQPTSYQNYETKERKSQALPLTNISNYQRHQSVFSREKSSKVFRTTFLRTGSISSTNIAKRSNPKSKNLIVNENRIKADQKPSQNVYQKKNSIRHKNNNSVTKEDDKKLYQKSQELILLKKVNKSLNYPSKQLTRHYFSNSINRINKKIRDSQQQRSSIQQQNSINQQSFYPILNLNSQSSKKIKMTKLTKREQIKKQIKQIKKQINQNKKQLSQTGNLIKEVSRLQIRPCIQKGIKLPNQLSMYLKSPKSSNRQNLYHK